MRWPLSRSASNGYFGVWLGICTVLLTAPPPAQAGVDLLVAEEGKPACAIVLPAHPSELTQHAAGRLQSAVQAMGSVELPLVPAGQETSVRCRILLGSLTENATATEFLRQRRLIVPPPDREQAALKRALISENLGPEGFVIYAGEFQGHPTLALAGHTPLGSLYAVETFVDRLYREGNRILAGPLNSEETPLLNLPAFRVRSIATNLGGPDWLAGGQWEQEWQTATGYDWRGFVDWMVSHKINNLNAWIFNLAFGIAYDSKRFPELVNRRHPNVRHEFMGNLIDYAHRRGIRVFIMIDFPDNWTAVVKAYPYLAGKNFNPADIPDGLAWEQYQKYGERRLGQSGEERFRQKFSWVCGSEPRTLEFWKEYLEELLGRYPGIDGIGVQFSENDRERCNCDQCTRNHFGIVEKFFAEMVTVGRRRNADMKFWVYDSWGTRDILLHRDRYPNFLNIDWSGALAPLYYRQYIPRSDWYLFHKMAERFPEFAYKHAAQALNERGLHAMQIRAPAYKPYDNAYQAFEEFSWNPRLNLEQYAELYVRKLQGRRDRQLTELYSAWINFMGYNELAGAGRGGVAFYENPRPKEDKGRADAARAAVARLLLQVRGGPELVEAIRTRLDALEQGHGSAGPPISSTTGARKGR